MHSADVPDTQRLLDPPHTDCAVAWPDMPAMHGEGDRNQGEPTCEAQAWGGTAQEQRTNCGTTARGTALVPLLIGGGGGGANNNATPGRQPRHAHPGVG